MEEQKPAAAPNPAHQAGTEKGEERPKKEGKEAGRKDTGTTGKAERPTGKTTARESTPVNPKEPVDPESPNLPTP